jgi:hypothetical protein
MMVGCALLLVVVVVAGPIATFLRSIWDLSAVSALAAGLVASSTIVFGSLKLLSWWTPPYPPCKNKRCRDRDYREVAANDAGIVVVCRCGTRYWRTPHAKRHAFDGAERFIEVVGGRSLRSYMKRTTLRRWHSDAEGLPPGFDEALPKSLALDAYRTSPASQPRL